MKQQYNDLVAKCIEAAQFLETYGGPEKQELINRLAIIMDELGEMEDEVAGIEA